jgi:hypothetical protein
MRASLPALSALLLAFCLAAPQKAIAQDSPLEADVCIYGGTSAGVIAAVAAARAGKTALLLEPGKRLGGLTSSGLGATDTGNKEVIGGLSREFYRRLGKRYGKEEAWAFEPGAAEETFRELAREAGVRVVHGARLARVDLDGRRLAALRGESGEIFRARVFIDATYEGDLLAAAKVTYTVGREPNARYGETLNGVRAETPFHQFEVAVDPHVKPGDPASGLLPFIQPGDGGVPGAGDRTVQAYNFRLCLTQDPANRKAIAPPAGYDPARYELLARYLEALVAAGKAPSLSRFLSIKRMPNGKTDMNNNGPFSTDYIGGSWAWPEASPAERARIQKEHEDYTRGFLHFLATSPRVPEALRAETRSWGLARDEFPETDGWPPQLYVREGRRMVSDHVMTERHCRGLETPAEPAGMGSYNMDSHNCQRLVKDGRAVNEGDVQVRVPPYSISYRSLVPRRGECENLLVPVCLSASHIAYGSIRMEPVFMVLGHSAGVAAALAIAAGVPVQDVPYPRLEAQLVAERQVLRLGR